MIVLSARQVKAAHTAWRAGRSEAEISPDLGLTSQAVSLSPGGIVFPGGASLSWDAVERILEDAEACWLVAADAVRTIHAFSETTQRAYSLLATDSAPTLINAGFTMHRIRRSNPRLDTINKIRAAAPVRGRVLDTTTGLGYTAIEAARTAGQVITIEIDPTVLEIARLNPWSQPLFECPNIQQLVGDSYQEILQFDDGSFDLVIHDPPTLSLAGELYSGVFYRQLFRVLRPGGRLFHYLGNPESKQGHSVTRGAIRRLQDAGFQRLKEGRDAFGVVAIKRR